MTISTNPLTNFEAEAKAFFEKAEADVVAFANQYFPIVESDLEVAFEDLAEIAGAALVAAAGKYLTGGEVIGAAVASVIQTIEASGKTVAVATAQAAVQSAVVVAQSVAAQAKTS